MSFLSICACTCSLWELPAEGQWKGPLHEKTVYATETTRACVHVGNHYAQFGRSLLIIPCSEKINY